MMAGLLTKDTTRRVIALGFCASVIGSHFVGVIAFMNDWDQVAAFCVPGRELLVIVTMIVGFFFGADTALKKPGEDTEV